LNKTNITRIELPKNPEDLTPELLTALISRMHPGISVKSVDLTEIKGYGEQNVSTSARVKLTVAYGDGTKASLPTQLVVKMSLDPSVAYCAQLHAIYANEVSFYNRLRPELDIEAPRGLGGYFDPATQRYALVLEDLSLKSAHFPSVMQDIGLDDVRKVLRTLARLHARYWQSPRFKTDLSWVQTHTQGDVEDLMNGLISDSIAAEIQKEKYKRELVGRMRTSEPELRAGVAALKRHQSTLPQTLLHGDSHIGNTYLTADSGGLLDWQIMVRGYAMHDVTYFITTALPIELRRKTERELLAFYRDSLQAHGVANPPDMASLWLEYCRAGVWGVYIGWMSCPVANYGWEVNIMSLLRVTTAFEDHDSRKLMLDLQ
jgi:Ecdysteroid kinase-like family